MIIKKMRLSAAVVAMAGSMLLATPVSAATSKETAAESTKSVNKY
jgi:hypothetical protein